MISQTAEYALRAICYLADNPDESLTADTIAKATKVPVGYLSKIMHMLVKAGLVTSQRGPRGGFLIAAAPRKIRVYDVFEAVEPIRRIKSCPLEIGAHKKLCNLHRMLDGTLAHMEQVFKRTTLADLIDDSNGTKVLCEH